MKMVINEQKELDLILSQQEKIKELELSDELKEISRLNLTSCPIIIEGLLPDNYEETITQLKNYYHQNGKDFKHLDFDKFTELNKEELLSSIMKKDGLLVYNFNLVGYNGHRFNSSDTRKTWSRIGPIIDFFQEVQIPQLIIAKPKANLNVQINFNNPLNDLFSYYHFNEGLLYNRLVPFKKSLKQDYK